MSIRFTVCIPATRPALLRRAVQSVLGQDWQDWDLVVVGQGDHRALQAALDTVAPGDARIQYMALRERGLSRARNAASGGGTGNVIAFLDDDCEADPGWLTALAAAFTKHPRAGLVGGALVAPPAERTPSTCPSLNPAEALYEPAPGLRPPAGWDVIGANIAIRREVLRTVGSWDNHLGSGAEFPAGEDTDYKLRLEAAGVPMFSTPSAVVHHTGGRRYGRQILASQRNYAYGNGALAAKQTLSGDPRGTRWLRDTRVDCLTAWVRHGRLHRIPIDLRRLYYFSSGYSRCLREFDVDGLGLLRPRRGAAAGNGIVAAAGPLEALRAALDVRRSLKQQPSQPFAVPLVGGCGGLIAAADQRRLVSLLRAGDKAGEGGLLVRRMERRQARRSELVLVSDRATGVSAAMRWGIPLDRIGLLRSDEELSPSGLARRLELASFARKGAWHRR
jgi:GT2 family glycosyltransferase